MPFITKFGGAAPSRGVAYAAPPIPTVSEAWASGNASGTEGAPGYGDLTDRSSPVQIGSKATWIYLSGGWHTGFGATSDGKLWTWGRGDEGETGQNSTTDTSGPTQVGSLTDWGAADATSNENCLAGGSEGCMVIKEDGTLWGWGDQTPYPFLGDGTTTNRSSPVQIGSLTDWSQIQLGYGHSHAIKTDGTLWGWGNNTSGFVGDGTTTVRSSPVQIGSDTNWSNLSGGGQQTYALRDGTLWAWGGGTSYGQIGQGNTSNYSSPVQIGSASNWVHISCNNESGHFINSDGELYAVGRNWAGDLGLGDSGAGTHRSTLVQVGSLTTWKATIACAGNGHAGTTTSHALWAWGENTSGQLGLNNLTSPQVSPVQVGSLTDWKVPGSEAQGYSGTDCMHIFKIP